MAKQKRKKAKVSTHQYSNRSNTDSLSTGMMVPRTTGDDTSRTTHLRYLERQESIVQLAGCWLALSASTTPPAVTSAPIFSFVAVAGKKNPVPKPTPRLRLRRSYRHHHQLKGSRCTSPSYTLPLRIVPTLTPRRWVVWHTHLSNYKNYLLLPPLLLFLQRLPRRRKRRWWSSILRCPWRPL